MRRKIRSEEMGKGMRGEERIRRYDEKKGKTRETERVKGVAER